MKRVRTTRAHQTFVVDGTAPSWAHDLARQIERALAGFLLAPNSGPFTYKSDMVDRMSDSELSVFETELEQTTVRMRQKWYAIQAVYHRAPDYPMFYGVFVDTFGMARADQILKASGSA